MIERVGTTCILWISTFLSGTLLAGDIQSNRRCYTIPDSLSRYSIKAYHEKTKSCIAFNGVDGMLCRVEGDHVVPVSEVKQVQNVVYHPDGTKLFWEGRASHSLIVTDMNGKVMRKTDFDRGSLVADMHWMTEDLVVSRTVFRLGTQLESKLFGYRVSDGALLFGEVGTSLSCVPLGGVCYFATWSGQATTPRAPTSVMRADERQIANQLPCDQIVSLNASFVPMSIDATGKYLAGADFDPKTSGRGVAVLDICSKSYERLWNDSEGEYTPFCPTWSPMRPTVLLCRARSVHGVEENDVVIRKISAKVIEDLHVNLVVKRESKNSGEARWDSSGRTLFWTANDEGGKSVKLYVTDFFGDEQQ